MRTRNFIQYRNFAFFCFFLSFHSNAESSSEICQQDFQSGNNIYFISPHGKDYKGDGSRLKPWKNIDVAASRVPDGSIIIVTQGIYEGSLKFKRPFEKGLLIKSEYPYQAKLTNDKRVIAFVGNASNITIEGFEITHNSDLSSPLVLHIDGGGTQNVHHINIRNNIIHDSFNNDLLKINYGAEHINIECNMFYNQGDSDEHIDINSVASVTVSDNIFFNDFAKTNRTITKKSSSFIVIKDSNDNEDRFKGSKDITLTRNVFFNWQGSEGHGFVLIGEDGKPYYEASDVNIYNNLMIGNSSYPMRSPLGLKGAKNINFYNNTITGNLPSNAYALRVNKEGANKINTNLTLSNNIWSDKTGTMGQQSANDTNDFSDVLFNQLDDFSMNNNIIFNGINELPSSYFDKVNPSDDKFLINDDPHLPEVNSLITPVWLKEKQEFDDGSFTIREAFLRLVLFYGKPTKKLPVQSPVNKIYFPKKDILGKIRTAPHSIGAFHIN